LNLASQGVAKNMGMTYERTAIYDAVECQVYSITREDWLALQKANEKAARELHTAEKTHSAAESQTAEKSITSEELNTANETPKKEVTKAKAKQAKAKKSKKST
jgi:hypothetical protein